LVSFFRGKSPTTADYLAKSNQTITTSKCGDEIGQPFIPATRTREPLDELPTASTLPTLSATARSSFCTGKKQIALVTVLGADGSGLLPTSIWCPHTG
jgi:hypothetical protein